MVTTKVYVELIGDTSSKGHARGHELVMDRPDAKGGRNEGMIVGARLKLTTCAGLKLTRCYSGVDYYAAVDKSTRL
jgi:hypothetical protein